MSANESAIPDNNESDVLVAKVITMVTLFSVSMIFGCLPLLISLRWDWFTKGDGSNIRSSNKVVMGLLAFGGGVLFATTFMHLLPEVDENIELLQEQGILPEFDIFLAPLIMCSGFFMMYLIEELVHLYIDKRNANNQGNFTRALSIRRRSNAEQTSEVSMMEKKDIIDNYGIEGQHSHLPTVTGNDDTIGNALRGLLIVLALSIHELFEGLAVGLESSASNVWYMFGAVSAHKYLIAFCIGVELIAAKTKRWLSIAYIFVYSFVSALGIAIGIALVGGAGAAGAGISSVVLQGIACGTLVYVVFFEVWRTEKSSLMQFFFSLLGFAVMVGLEVIGHDMCLPWFDRWAMDQKRP